ncbi:similar to deoxyribonuclease tatD [Plenodomus lingam JN3]|uniref:Similar to deoxyribonuclease tatD n=2 Tax=Leptosphaeria maculans TaxID=5022 RepID=E5R472_LEPMJ|nr:similar to deoxyribonuclease tatD [Plenodomus lingam JN3]CBX91840.1 similar to deoxyribonuclease tatD [Plenodomus lingam JN3]
MSSEAPQPAPAAKPIRYIDIGINFTDPVFHGLYHGTQRHASDFPSILQRALDVGCQKFMVTGSDLAESKHAIEIAKAQPGLCYATVGVHPCSAHQFDTYPGGPGALLSALKEVALDAKATGHAVAFGEIGLDYDRLFLTPKEQQLKYFEAQLELAVELQLPLFLHSRAASEDFERLLTAKLESLPKRGLVHSFTGTVEEMQRLVDLGFDIGVNGCSMKTPENIAVAQKIPLSHLHLETDGPWCEMRPSHASAAYLKDAPPLPKAVKKEKFVEGCMVKGRNESVAITHVAWAVAGIKGVSVDEVAEAAWRNSVKMFGLGEKVE